MTRSASEPLLHLDGVRKTFGDVDVLHGVNLRVMPGEIVGFVGPNGAGKTTSLRCTVGITHRSGGTIHVLGHDPDTHPVAVRSQVSYLPGETSVYENMRGKDFLKFALHFYPGRQQDILDELQRGFKLPLEKRVRTYSAGMKQKLALMAAIVPDVPLYLLDEPDRALDATTRLFLREVLITLRDRGKAVLFSSHHLNEVKLIAQRTEFLVSGRNVPSETIADVEAKLKNRIWIRLRAGVELPFGATPLHTDPDGTTLVDVQGSPIAWLQKIPADDIQSAEVGLTRLEDLYSELAKVAPAAVPAGSQGDQP